MEAKRFKTAVLGYPRIGDKRELKKATEQYWKGEITKEQLLNVGKDLRKRNWKKQQDAGIDFIASNDFSFYDQMLDLSYLLGNIPARFEQSYPSEPEINFLIARGRNIHTDLTAPASEMTKWFDTNYHYIVPEFSASTNFHLSSTKIFDEYREALALGVKTRPVLIGPVTYLTLGKTTEALNKFDLLDPLLKVYEQILQQLSSLGAEWVQIDEPIFSLDLTEEQKAALTKSYAALAKSAPLLKIMVATYFNDLRDNLPCFLRLPVAGLHIDATRGAKELSIILRDIDQQKMLSVGIVDGRNIWKNDFAGSLKLIERCEKILGAERLIISSSCSLLHTPITLELETKLDDEFKSWLAFADEKLKEIVCLAKLAGGQSLAKAFEENQLAITSRRQSGRIYRPDVKKRLENVKPADFERQSVFAKRRLLQQKKLNLPAFPTTTIGSFPQTEEVREQRALWKKGSVTTEEYEDFIKAQIKESIDIQHKIGIDMLVHGEFERNDMVEYFGELLDGFAFTQNGWVQSYGSRYVKPPVVFGDVSRPTPMTVRWSTYAQSLTKQPMKGMLTGPITIAQWSFVRDDQPREVTVKQIALAIRDEVRDLEAAGIDAIQIDEPAIREGLPLRRSDWTAYLKWAVEAFRLSASVVKDQTQIHTHMCYSEFNDIIQAIADLDADVISIETSRSKMELLDAFVKFQYPNEIGPGVYDIHSPQIPSQAQMEDLLYKAIKVLPKENIWVNPDCGLKTRGWAEVIPALKNMVAAAKAVRIAAASKAK